MRKDFKHYIRAFKRDIYNSIKYGPSGPKYAQLIFIDAGSCDKMLRSEHFINFYKTRLRAASSLIVNKWPYQFLGSVVNHEKVRYCVSHWADGLSWKDAGAYDYLLEKIAKSECGVYDECSSLDDVKRRYDDLDCLFEHAALHGLQSRQEFQPESYREVGGAIVHLGPDAVPCFGGAGYHRFAIAKILNLRFPAQIGCVHVSALDRIDEFCAL